MIIRRTAIGHKYNGITAVPSEGMTVLNVKIKEDMNICVFYSWQSKYRDNCNKIIEKALDKAIEDLNRLHPGFHFDKERGGGDVLGAEHIDNNIDKIICTKADLAVVDFTHTGNIPQRNPGTNEWIKVKHSPNTCATYEDGKLEIALGPRQVFKVYNTAYGEIDVNLEPPFDLRQEHYPIAYSCDDSKSKEDRKHIIENLKKSLVGLLWEGTKDFMNNQKVRYTPLIPMRHIYAKKMFSTPFKRTEAFEKILAMAEKGRSFRLLALPGLGKTRMVGEAFHGKDNDVYYCDCKEQPNKDVMKAIDQLMEQRGATRQTIILDNCNQGLCTQVDETIKEYGYNCQLISIHYDPRERVESGIEGIPLKVEDFDGIVEDMVSQVEKMPNEVKKSITELSGGFPLMAAIMIENFKDGVPVVDVSKGDVFYRMLGVRPDNESDVDKLKVLTAFSILKFIGLYGPQEKQGRFVANNSIITGLRGNEDEKLQLFKEVHGQYQPAEILERQGNLVLMRLIPLAIYLCKKWFDKQTMDSISELIEQIRAHEDEGTRNMLIESLSRRITLLADVPLAKELNDGLTNPDGSPFLNEEVVLSTLGSRLFLAFSEVNPESCAFALHRIIEGKSDDEIRSIGDARRNLAWALDHLAFDKRSFRNAMLTLARFSLVETEGWLSNNTTGLFVDRFPIMLPGTEADFAARIEVLRTLASDHRYDELVKKTLYRALGIGHFYRSGGAERQGLKSLKDYVPTVEEVKEYFNVCFSMLLDEAKSPQDYEDIAKVLSSNARGYYIHGVEDFLLRGIETIAPKRDYVWEEMKDALTYLIDYDAKKRKMYRVDEFQEWVNRLTKDDYVYTLLHAGKEIRRQYDDSFEEETRKTHERYRELAIELVDKGLFKDEAIMAGVMAGQCFYYNSYGITLSEYSKEKGIQGKVLHVLLEYVLHKKVSRDGESMMIYFLLKVEDRELLEETYKEVIVSNKKRLLPALFAIKAEGAEKLDLLFNLLDDGQLELKDFSSYFNYLALSNYNVKFVAGRLLDYGADGAQLVLSHCHNLLFGNKELDKEYEAIARRCLIQIDLKGIQMDDHLYLQSMNNYLVKHHDEEMALRIQSLQERGFLEQYSRDNYYLGRLYRKVLCKYTDLLKPRLLELLVDEKVRHSWIDLLRTSYPQERGEEDPIYTVIPIDDWFEWLGSDANKDKAYALAMMLQYSKGGEANPDMLRLIDCYWCDEVRSAISYRLHSFSWTGSGMPLYKSRIALCEDYAAKTKNEEARMWFKKDVKLWEQEIDQERLQNAHERAIYD